VSATTPAPATIKQRSARRTVDTLIVVLLALAAIVLGVTFWYWRVTKPPARAARDHEHPYVAQGSCRSP